VVFKLAFKNLFRYPVRSLLTMVGVAVAILSFGILSTVVDSWYAGAEGASSARLIVRSSVSLMFPLPLPYRDRIKQVEGVQNISWARWFGGIYKEPKNFFPQFAIDPRSYLDMYPEYVVPNEEKQLFIKDKRSVLIGRKIADEHKLKPGDSMTLKGQIFPGNWDFVIAGIYEGKTKGTDTAQLFFHWDYLNEEIRKRGISRDKEAVGVFIVEVDDIDKVGNIAKSIDDVFANSPKETRSETEKAFQLGFVAMTEAIVVAIRLVSYVVIIIIMLVMANTMIMTARERVWEYATLRSIGFGKFFLTGLITSESCLLALFGGTAGIALTFPAAEMFRTVTGTLFPVFEISKTTILLQILLSLLTGAFAAIFPAWKANTVNIVRALRAS